MTSGVVMNDESVVGLHGLALYRGHILLSWLSLSSACTVVLLWSTRFIITVLVLSVEYMRRRPIILNVIHT